MTVLPGAKHLVASMADYTYTVYSLILFVVDHRHGGLVPLAKLPTETKAYNVRAKYMTIRGVNGIVIGYVRREFVKNSRRDVGFVSKTYFNTLDLIVYTIFRVTGIRLIHHITLMRAILTLPSLYATSACAS